MAFCTIIFLTGLLNLFQRRNNQTDIPDISLRHKDSNTEKGLCNAASGGFSKVSFISEDGTFFILGLHVHCIFMALEESILFGVEVLLKNKIKLVNEKKKNLTKNKIDFIKFSLYKYEIKST